MNNRVFLLHFFLLVSLCVSQSIYAQKYVKHHEKYFHFTWYEIKYANGNVGLSFESKKNIIFNEEREYTSIQVFNYSKRTFLVTKNGYKGVVDRQGNEIIAPNRYKSLTDHHDFIEVHSKNMYEAGDSVGMYRSTGKEIVPCIYNSVKIKSLRYTYKNITNFKDKVYLMASMSDRYGNHGTLVCDTTGLVWFESSFYDFAEPQPREIAYSDDYKSIVNCYVIKRGNYEGVCYPDGREWISPIYKRVSIYGTYAIVTNEEDKSGVIDSEGNILIFPKYDYINKSSSDMLFTIQQKNKYGLCDITGKEVVPPLYNDFVIYNSGQYLTKVNGEFVAIDPTNFTNPEQKIASSGRLRILVGDNGETISKHGYELLEWDEQQSKYIGTLYGYTTLIDLLGNEDTSISEQIFNEAINNNDIYEQANLYNLIIMVDADNKEGYKAMALNNIGVIYGKEGDEDTALEYFMQSSLLGCPEGTNNANNINKKRKNEARLEKLEKFNERLNQFTETLSMFSSIAPYSSFSNGNTSSFSSNSTQGNTSARQSAYNHMANRAAHIYQQLTNKKGYVGSDKTHSVDVTTYNKLRRDMRNYRIKSQHDGITLQKSQYEDLTL